MTSNTQNDSDYRRAVPTSLYPPVRGMGRYYSDSDGDATHTQAGDGVYGLAQSILDAVGQGKAADLLAECILDRQTGKNEMMARLKEAVLETSAAQVAGIPNENLQNVVFDLDLREVLGNENVQMLHTAGLPESLMLDIYMSWRTMTKRAPETDADFVQYNAFVHDQLEMIYDGMPEEVTQQVRTNCGVAPQGDADDGQSRFLDLLVPNVVNLSWVAGSRAEQEIGPVLATMPNHEFVIDSVRDLPGNSIGMTVTDDPRMTDLADGDPKEMGPVGYFVRLDEDGKPIKHSIVTVEEALKGTFCDRPMSPAISSAKAGIYMTGLVDTAVIPQTAAQQVDWTKIHQISTTAPPAKLDPPVLVNEFQQYFQK